MPDNPETPPGQPPASTTPAAPATDKEKDARMWHMLCHMSALILGVVGPLLIWQIKKGEIPSIESHGKAAVNFQLTVLIAIFASSIVGGILLFICIGVIFFFLSGAIAIAGAVFAIIAGLKANEGKDYKYPYSLNLIK